MRQSVGGSTDDKVLISIDDDYSNCVVTAFTRHARPWPLPKLLITKTPTVRSAMLPGIRLDSVSGPKVGLAISLCPGPPFADGLFGLRGHRVSVPNQLGSKVIGSLTHQDCMVRVHHYVPGRRNGISVVPQLGDSSGVLGRSVHDHRLQERLPVFIRSPSEAHCSTTLKLLAGPTGGHYSVNGRIGIVNETPGCNGQ